ncbi:MAG: translation elongation factor-like protein [Deltaproteobacteria bacterium RIFCSPHIGHO2_12_FULL_43_9]|nr:MAG: translation elongation factor-like protein [Deltaproteobacteria bacterium RIFCSPHIGHO2_12_FULL_43_9]
MIEHFFGEINVAAIKLRKPLKVGDKIHIKGHTTDFSQTVDSMQIEHQSVTDAPSGSDIGIKVTDRVREHDIVYKVD